MDQVLDFFRKLFDVSDWPPRWHCGNWTEFHGWLYIISDLLIWTAYFAIPLAILKYISRRTGAKFVRAYFLFAAFILACGSTHLLDAVSFWFPAYRLSALVRFVTGVVSWVTVFYLIRILPAATSLRPYEELEKEIKERKRIEDELKTANEQLNFAQEIGKIGHWQWDVATNRITWSKQLFKIYGLQPTADNPSFEDFIRRVHPEDREMMEANIREALEKKVFQERRHRILLDDGNEKMLQAHGEVITDENGNVVRMVGTGQDITDQQFSQQQLLERTRELEMSNAELKKFAYVASHDLQEPLRKIMTFTSLLEKEIPAPPEKVKLYMDKISAASGRMQKLIEDILRFSSYRAESGSFVKTDLNQVLQQVISDLEVQIEAAGAVINTGSLPVIDAIPSQVGQLFQNLLNNAMKFRKPGRPPEITVSGRVVKAGKVKNLLINPENNLGLMKSMPSWEREQFVQIEITDNGIGFDEKYSGKIFEIFQRLHGSGYGGTGIGLAICKKIVDNHHGVIMAESNTGEGSKFTILLPVSQQIFFPKD